MSLLLQNPHSILAVLETRPRDVVELRLASRGPRGLWREVAERAQALGVSVADAAARKSSGRRRRAAVTEAGRRGDSWAMVKERTGVSLEELFRPACADAERTLYVAMDRLQDPHNVGAIFRTAAFFGVRGLILTRERSAPLSATVYDVASGGIEYVPFCVQTNLSRALQNAKKAGLWVLGTSEHAPTAVQDVPQDRSWLVVFGNEERGLRRLTSEQCDLLCRIEPRSPIRSLNVSVAAGILIARLAGSP